jgi:hypothetical protein
MKAICFFNHYHNGDLFNSKSFITEIISNINTKYYYAHSNDPIVLSDLDVEYCNIPNISHSDRFVDVGDVLYVNTWIGSYFDPKEEYYGECTLRFLYNMFGKIYEKLNEVFGSNLHLSEINSYFPSVDYSKFNISQIQEFLRSTNQKKILISNGPCLSGQCDYSGDMSSVIKVLSQKNKDKLFIITHPINVNIDNVIFTNDVINSDKCDLNEISYISTFCDIIVGRNSGPFCFSSTKQNLMDASKTLYAFGNKETDCFMYGVDVECNFIFEYFSNLENLTSSLDQIIKSI